MANYTLTARATQDIDRLYETGILSFGLRRADNYYDDLFELFEHLALNPRLYRERTSLNPPVRVCPYESHVILYCIDGDGIKIIRVRHNREDWR